MYEDQIFSNRYRLLLFDLARPDQSETEALHIDELVRAETQRQLPPAAKINYYFPQFVRWSGPDVIVSVGLVTVNGETGPFTARCYGYRLGINPLEVHASLSGTELGAKFGASCRIWP